MARRGALGNDNPCSDLQSRQRTTGWVTARIAITLVGDGDGTGLEISAGVAMTLRHRGVSSGRMSEHADRRPIMIHCPKSDQEIPTKTWATPEEFEADSSSSTAPLECPACGEVHYWSRDDAFLGDVGDVDASEQGS